MFSKMYNCSKSRFLPVSTRSKFFCLQIYRHSHNIIVLKLFRFLSFPDNRAKQLMTHVNSIFLSELDLRIYYQLNINKYLLIFRPMIDTHRPWNSKCSSIVFLIFGEHLQNLLLIVFNSTWRFNSISLPSN